MIDQIIIFVVYFIIGCLIGQELFIIFKHIWQKVKKNREEKYFWPEKDFTVEDGERHW